MPPTMLMIMICIDCHKPNTIGSYHRQEMGVKGTGKPGEDSGHGKRNDPVLHQIHALMLGKHRIEGVPANERPRRLSPICQKIKAGMATRQIVK